MATQKTVLKRSLHLYSEDGVNNDGTQKLKAQTYNGIKEAASADDMLEVANAIAGLKEKGVAQVVITEKAEIAATM